MTLVALRHRTIPPSLHYYIGKTKVLATSSLPSIGATAPAPSSAVASATTLTARAVTSAAADRFLFVGEVSQSQTPMDQNSMNDDDFDCHRDDDDLIDHALAFGQYSMQG